MAAVTFYAYADKIRRWNFTNLFVYRKITIRKKGKWYIVCLLKITDFQCRITDPDADQFNLSFKSDVAFDFAIHLIDRGSLPLTEGSVHIEYLNNNDVSFNLRDAERILTG